MKTSLRATFLFSAVIVGLVWTGSTEASAQSGVYLTNNGYRAPLYGTSQHVDADGVVTNTCGKLPEPLVQAARIGRRVSRAMMASSPLAVVTTDGGASFEITYTDATGTGFNDTAEGATRRKALEAAFATWSKVLKATQLIKVEASMHDMDDGDDDPTTTLLATAGPTEFWVIDNKAVPSSLAWQLLGGKYSNAGDSDITVNVNLGAKWNYALNASVPRGDTSFVYTLMHELGHGLGLIDSFEFETGKPLNDPLLFVYDPFLNRGSSKTNRMSDHAAEERKRDMESGDLFFNGQNTIEASQKSIKPAAMVKMYAPKPYEPGSSIAHVDQELYADVRTGLMCPIDFGAGVDKIDIITQGMIKDLGYTLVANPPVPNPASSTGTRKQ